MRSYSDQSESALSDWSEYERTGKAWERVHFLIGLSTSAQVKPGNEARQDSGW